MKDATAIFAFSSYFVSLVVAFVGKYGPPPLKQFGFVLSDCSARFSVLCSGKYIPLFPLLILRTAPSGLPCSEYIQAGLTRQIPFLGGCLWQL
jgi:hypothetical protein